MLFIHFLLSLSCQLTQLYMLILHKRRKRNWKQKKGSKHDENFAGNSIKQVLIDFFLLYTSLVSCDGHLLSPLVELFLPLFVLQREFVIYRSSYPSVDDNIRHRDRKEWHHVWVRLWREYGSVWKTSCYWERSLSTSYFSSRGCFSSLKGKWLQLLNVLDWDFAFHYILLLHSSISHSRLLVVWERI